MKEKLVDKYLHLRLLVGYLGESPHFGWWQTTLLQPTSRPFLDPVFARTSKLAQYHGVREAARRLHDEHIGLGRVSHLFRLPEEMERDMHKRIEEQSGVENMFESLANKETALSALALLAQGDREAAEGPISIGKANDLLSNKVLKEMACCYSAAFKQGLRSYPYLLPLSSALSTEGS
jgi:hypothetical protein